MATDPGHVYDPGCVQGGPPPKQMSWPPGHLDKPNVQWILSAGWCENTITAAQARCLDVLCAWKPPHNLPIWRWKYHEEDGESYQDGVWFELVQDHGIIVEAQSAHLSTFDADELTRLVVAAHRLSVRVEISATISRDEFGEADRYAQERLRISFYARKPAAPGMNLFERHPTAQQLAQKLSATGSGL